MKARWKTRCSECGNPMHLRRYYALGWLAYWLLVKPWPVAWGLPPLLAVAGDCIFDARECRCENRQLLEDVPDAGRTYPIPF